MKLRLMKTTTALGFLSLALCCATTAHADHADISDYLVLTPGDPGDAVTMADLLSGDPLGVIVGDKIFDEFFYLPNDDMPEPEDVKVSGFQDNDGNYGLSFRGDFRDLPGGSASDASLQFTVEVAPDELAEGFRISDAHLFLGGVSVGNNSSLAVDESFQGIAQTLNTFATTLSGPLSQNLADEVFFGQLHTKLRVTKDILAFSGDASMPALTSVIDQSFSQVEIPEPTTCTLALAALCLAIGRRRAF
jgi:hypothetical protein